MDESDVRPPGHDPVHAVMGLLSRSGPEVPPDLATSSPAAAPSFGDEPTELLPVISPAAPTIAPKVEARAVIVYEPQPRRSWGLWLFTALLVALTVGVVLGQTAAYQPPSRPAPALQAAPMPTYSTPPEPAPSPSGPASPVGPQQFTAPLGATRTQLIEVTGAATLLHIRSAELGTLLFSVATMDGGTAPTILRTARAVRLDLTRTGVAADAGRIEVQLNSAVRWTVRLTGESAEREIDMRAGGLAGIELAGISRTVLDLPDPTGTVPLRVIGAVRDLQIRTGDGVPVRLRLGKGADTAAIDGARPRSVEPGTVLSTPGWRSARNRYDVKASAKVGSVRVDHAPPGARMVT